MATEIVVDTETTGLKPEEGHRIVEVGMVEIEGFGRTGRSLHRYLNPERSMPAEAYGVHGLSAEFLGDKPLFGDVADEILEFIGESRLVVHNAEFDLGFINHELDLIGRQPILPEQVLDTLQLARRELPGISGYSLDALCRHFGVDRSQRTKHGAMLDAELLTEVYFHLTGGGQGLLDLLGPNDGTEALGPVRIRQKPRETKLKPLLTPEEEAAHLEFVKKSLGEAPLWNNYTVPEMAQ